MAWWLTPRTVDVEVWGSSVPIALFPETRSFNLLCLSSPTCIQLFRERLSETVHTTIPKGIVGGFEF